MLTLLLRELQIQELVEVETMDLDRAQEEEYSVEALEEFNQPEVIKILNNLQTLVHREVHQDLESLVHPPAEEVLLHPAGEHHLVTGAPVEEEGAPRDQTLVQQTPMVLPAKAQLLDLEGRVPIRQDMEEVKEDLEETREVLSSSKLILVMELLEAASVLEWEFLIVTPEVQEILR